MSYCCIFIAVFDEDEFFLELAKKTLDPVRVGTKLLRSMAEVENCLRDMCTIYLTWHAEMTIKETSYLEMRKILWKVLDTTRNEEAKDFLVTKLKEHDLLHSSSNPPSAPPREKCKPFN